jgi:hypothetical protein
MSWQCIVDRQQACPAVIENQTIRRGHFALQKIIKNRELADGLVKLSTLHEQVLPALPRSPIRTGSNLLPETIR